ncbi:lipopolysaccharide assembly protein LapA domain-containing protein [uncultured Sphingomonas sp.]|uniref:lipopolysaccharide assembly protein LapA domain-containing protein n=1 Tax=uncultured Sphingomonas sp. TaxID=158754 RepID=UPI0035CA5FA3
MQFLKILFWCLLAFLAAVFTLGNWISVPIRLWGGMIAETNLPLLLLIVFLVGLLPTLIVQHVHRWRLRQRLAAVERQLADLRALPVAPVVVAQPHAIVAQASVAVPPPPVIAVPPVSADADSATGPDALL